ncbi:SDR family oxidoreductase [Cryobacterium adonitolivorans]|uniref:SDR family oxidoreductase n=1 Tax=Cryobacterium adonitolivorans TaxID=1259189 RepID=A0A4R8WCB1_9MICO|nr:SDR family oxidoreductase [Cryobacterium adonitolivorans]TFC04736.1 SDR family oxidoreductase [Cryobacterium adonitolivorans]
MHGRTALVTGVSRRKGIGYAVAVRLAELGASVFVQHFAPHDDEQLWGGDDLDAVRAGIRSALTEGAVFGDVSAALAGPDAAAAVVRAAVGPTGRVDILVASHARSGGEGSIFDMTAEMLDGHWQVNARATLLLTRAFAEQFGDAGLTPTVASELLSRGITLNTVNPGPVNTGYLDPETTDRPLDGMLEYLRTIPFGRFGEPTDPARLIGWLVGGFSLAN